MIDLESMKEEDMTGVKTDSVLLVVSNGNFDAGYGNLLEEVDGRKMGCGDWESLVAESYTLDKLCIRVDMNLISEHSRYFQGYMNFSESSYESLNVNWVLAVFCTLLQCIHGCQPCLSSSMVPSVIQGSIYFGMEDVIMKCIDWAVSTMCNIRWGAEDDFLSELLSIWFSARENGVKSMEELCVRSLGINFEQAMLEDLFVTLPISLLEACIDHPELTVKSEKQLCNALLLWYENQFAEDVVEDPIHIFKKDVFERPTHYFGFMFLDRILENMESACLLERPFGPSRCLRDLLDFEVKIQLKLLPVEFLLCRLAGKYPFSIFGTSMISTASDADLVDSVLDLTGELASKAARNYLNFKPVIRITEHLKELDVAGCYQITCHHLVAAAAQAPNIPEIRTWEGYELMTAEQKTWPNLAVFDNLSVINLSQCWRIDQSNLLLWLKLVCPNLVELRAPDCPHLLKFISQIGSGLPNLAVLDLSESEELVEIEGVVTRLKSTLLNCTPLWDFAKYGVRNNLKELFLRGRSEITDRMLLCIARDCPSLWAIDLSGCTELSDIGVADFLKSYTLGFKKLFAAGTGFGPACSKAIVKGSASSNQPHHTLETLNLDKCSVLGSEHFYFLLQALPSLGSLSVAFTRVDDKAFLAFCGTTLRHLNLRETKISGGALSKILARNLDLKDLNIRGCTHMALFPFHSIFSKIPFGWENVAVGWGISDSTFLSLDFASSRLQSLVIGVGGTISAATLACISNQCPKLRRLSLSFQAISDEDLSCALRRLKNLDTLELQNMTCGSRDLLSELVSSSQKLRKLRLERVTPWLNDNDVLLLCESCTGLQSLSILGCQHLTSETRVVGLKWTSLVKFLNAVSIATMANTWCGLRELRLEDCKDIFTGHYVWILLSSFPALQVLHLRHIGRGLPQNFIGEAARRLPLLQKLSVDLCDAVNDKFSYSEVERASLDVVYINRCKSAKGSFHGVNSSRTEASSHYFGRIHRDTIVLEWNSVRLKETLISERLTFE